MPGFSAFRFAVLCVVFLSAMGVAEPSHDAQPPAVRYKVSDAVLNIMRFPKDNAYIKIANKTLNTGCGDASGNPVLMNGCGMFGPPSTAEATYENAQQSFANLQKSTWKDFLLESKSSEVLSDSFHSSLPYEVFDIAKAAEGREADGIIFFSPIGFSARRNEALVCVLFFSYMEHVPTSANLFLLNEDAGGTWASVGRLTVMETQ